jgi:aspartate aminotransferase
MTWSAQVQRLLEPLDDFGRLHAATVRRLGGSVIDLSYPNPRFSVDRRPCQVLADIAADVGVDDLRYSPFGGFTTVRRKIAASLSRQHALPYTFRDVILTPGATSAISVILRALFRPSGRVAVICPCWMDQPLYAASAGLGFDLIPAGTGKHLDLAGVENAWTPETTGLIISQPASPTGVLYSDDELAGLAATLRRLGQRHGHAPILLSDEAHRDQVWGGMRFASPAAFYPETVSVYSFGKAWEMPGQRVGYAAVSPRWPSQETVCERLETGMRVTGHCAPTALMQHLAGALAGFTPRLGLIADLQRRARGRLRGAGYEVVEAQATRFVYARAPISDDTEFVRLLAHRGVLAMPSAVFHERGHFRLALNVADAALDRALDVLADLRAERPGKGA